VEHTLSELAARKSGALVEKLPRQAGQKEARWTQLLTGVPKLDAEPEPIARPVPSDIERRVAALEEIVRRLSSDLADLQTQLGIAKADEA
jgi:uncharacterized protein YceH (UPF0502 family)